MNIFAFYLYDEMLVSSATSEIKVTTSTTTKGDVQKWSKYPFWQSLQAIRAMTTTHQQCPIKLSWTLLKTEFRVWSLSISMISNQIRVRGRSDFYLKPVILQAKIRDENVPMHLPPHSYINLAELLKCWSKSVTRLNFWEVRIEENSSGGRG